MLTLKKVNRIITKKRILMNILKVISINGKKLNNNFKIIEDVVYDKVKELHVSGLSGDAECFVFTKMLGKINCDENVYELAKLETRVFAIVEAKEENPYVYKVFLQDEIRGIHSDLLQYLTTYDEDVAEVKYRKRMDELKKHVNMVICKSCEKRFSILETQSKCPNCNNIYTIEDIDFINNKKMYEIKSFDKIE